MEFAQRTPLKDGDDFVHQLMRESPQHKTLAMRILEVRAFWGHNHHDVRASEQRSHLEIFCLFGIHLMTADVQRSIICWDTFESRSENLVRLELRCKASLKWTLRGTMSR
jgi:hypothetical protein